MAKYICTLDFDVSFKLDGSEFPYVDGSEHSKERKDYDLYLNAKKEELLKLLEDNGFIVGYHKGSHLNPVMYGSSVDEQNKIDNFDLLEEEKSLARNEFIESVALENEIKHSQFALGKEVDLSSIVDSGNVVFTYNDWSSNVFLNPTVMDAWKASDVAIPMSGDFHHVFFEGFEFKELKDGIKYYELYFGS